MIDIHYPFDFDFSKIKHCKDNDELSDLFFKSIDWIQLSNIEKSLLLVLIYVLSDRPTRICKQLLNEYYDFIPEQFDQQTVIEEPIYRLSKTQEIHHKIFSCTWDILAIRRIFQNIYQGECKWVHLMQLDSSNLKYAFDVSLIVRCQDIVNIMEKIHELPVQGLTTEFTLSTRLDSECEYLCTFKPNKIKYTVMGKYSV